MATSAKSASPAKKKPASPAKKSSGKKPDIVEIDDEIGKVIEPPPPEVVEPDPEMTPEEAEQARKDYLLTRFWISARGFWSRNGDRLAWPFTIGLLILIVGNVALQYGINVWNRAIFDGIEKRDSATVFFLTGVFFPLAIGSVLVGVAQVFARMGIQRRWRAWLTNAVLTRWLAERSLLPAQPGRRRPQEPGIPHRRGSAHRHRLAGRFHRWRDQSAFLSATTFIVVLWTIGGALTVTLGGSQITIPGFLVIAAIALCRDRLRLDHGDRPPLRAGLRGQEPGGSRPPLHADPRARERREHRAAGRRGGRARRHRPQLHQRAAAMGAACRPAHAHHAGVAGLEPDCARRPDPAVRAEIPRRQHDARPGDAGGLRLHHRAERVRLAGRQLSAARRLERLRAPHRLADDVARRARACRDRATVLAASSAAKRRAMPCSS